MDGRNPFNELGDINIDPPTTPDDDLERLITAARWTVDQLLDGWEDDDGLQDIAHRLLDICNDIEASDACRMQPGEES